MLPLQTRKDELMPKLYREVLPERVEEIVIALTMSGAQAREIRPLIQELGTDIPDFCDNTDLYSVNYRINADYYGNIVKHLLVLERILDVAQIDNVSITEVNYAKSLILAVAAKLERIRWLINTRNMVTPVGNVWQRLYRRFVTRAK
jgi:hypothetical protein